MKSDINRIYAECSLSYTKIAHPKHINKRKKNFLAPYLFFYKKAVNLQSYSQKVHHVDTSIHRTVAPPNIHLYFSNNKYKQTITNIFINVYE